MQDESTPPPKKAPGKPFKKGDPRAGRPRGTKNKTTVEVRELAQSLVDDPKYLKALRARLLAGECPPPVETMLWHYAYGKPKESLELSGFAETHIHINGVMPVPPELAGEGASPIGSETTTTGADPYVTKPGDQPR